VQIIATGYLYQMPATVGVLHREPFVTSQVTTLSTRVVISGQLDEYGKSGVYGQ
jgi:hypothetical protein